MAQLPSGAIVSAVIALITPVVALLCAGVLVWLTWKRERYSYAALLAWFSILTSLAALVENTQYIVAWRDVFTANHVRTQANVHSDHPHLWIALTFGRSGLDLAIFWILMCAFTIQSLLIMFWAIELASSVYGMLGMPESRLNKSHELVLKYGKVVAIALPIAIDVFIQIPAVQNTDMLWFVLTHSLLLVSVVFSIIMMIFVFVKYVGYRRKVQRMLNSTDRKRSMALNRRSDTSGTSANHHGLYDRWLLPRFGVITLFLMFFEAFNISIQISNWGTMRAQRATTPPALDLSATFANSMMVSSIPRNLPGVAVFLVFGTTRIFRAKMYRAFWPRRWQRYGGAWNTPLATPYQAEAASGGTDWLRGQTKEAGAPQIDMRITTHSLHMWSQGDRTFAGWESRAIGCDVSPRDGGGCGNVVTGPHLLPRLESDGAVCEEEEQQSKGLMITFNVTKPLPALARGRLSGCSGYAEEAGVCSSS